jgi:hypothetical protein
VTKQGYKCHGCKRFFIERDGFEDTTYPKEIIALALHLFVEGLSLSKIREVVHQHHGYRPSEGSILNWVRKYSKIVRKFEQEAARLKHDQPGPYPTGKPNRWRARSCPLRARKKITDHFCG